MELIDLLAAAPPSPLLAPQLHGAFAVHDRLHLSDAARFAQVAPRIRAITCGGDSTVGADLIAQLPALEIIAVMGVGYDGIDVRAARSRGAIVTHTPDVLNDDVADLALALMLASARQIVRADAFVRSGEWAHGPMPLGRKLSGSRLGLVGIGRIGQGIAHRAAAFGMQVAYTARAPRPALPYAYFPDAQALAAHSDYLVVITPGGAATRGLIDANVLRALGPQGVLVNVARGSVVDEAALVEALERGTIAGAALDVFENEPAVPRRLCELPNVVLAPHIGSATVATRQAMADLVAANLRAHFAGERPPTPVPECRTA
jgi:lactate dehydrogenase-like 2-hydroxyacid dehydrogenase